MSNQKFLSGIDMSGQKVVNAADGSAGTDLVTLQQVQAYVAGLVWHTACRAASTTNLTLATPGATIDGVSMASGDRVLLKNQTTGSQNGAYTWTGASTTLTRVNDFTDAAGSPDGVQTVKEGGTFLIEEGTTNSGSAWTCNNTAAITVGTTAITFAQFGGGQSYTAGNGITISSNVVAVNPASGGGITVAAGGVSVDRTKVPNLFAGPVGDGSSTSIAVTHSLGTRDVHVTVYDSSTFAEVLVDNVRTSASVVTLNFATAPASGAYRIVVMG